MNTLNVVEAVFFAALEKASPEARDAYLAEACKDDPNLRRCVERLLAAHPKAGRFLDATSPGPLPGPAHPPLTERPGTVIGPYKLLQELGEGGFGVVFMAEQQEPVRRKVALKIIKPGMDSKQVIARFEAERQALALMDHPNIARVLDAGTTGEPGVASGRPYFVMELVKGVPITEFCDQNRLTPHERLELFTSVCAAVQHAHQKGVIHRDLKPSNILVTTYDHRPVVKVIDFGVAKAIDQKLTEQTLFTRVGQVIGTLEYMSPEQASLNALDVDTRSDVYALGVVLYELLTGSTPLDKEKLHSAGFAEMLRVIREEEPPKPSTRLSQSGHALPLLASYRKTESQKLPGLVRGELDWIAMKALEKDRNRRYATAAGLAADVQRYLRDEQVEACPPSLSYRLGKVVRKNRWAFIMGATVALLVLLGAVLSGWQAVRALRAERIAVAQRDEAEDARRHATASQGKAEQEAEAARAARDQGRRAHYGLSLALVPTAWESDNIRRFVDLLNQVRPGPEEEDLRGFEWHYWDRLLHQERRSVALSEKGAGQAALSSDGTRVAFWSVSSDGEMALKVVEPASERVVFSRVLGKDVRQFRSALSLNRDGTRLACLQSELRPGPRKEDEVPGGLFPASAKIGVVWDVDRGKQISVRGSSEEGFALVALDPDGKRLVGVERQTSSGTKDTPGAFSVRRNFWSVKVWDLVRPDQEPIFTQDVKDLRSVARVVFSPDSSRLALLGHTRSTPPESSVQVWDLAARKQQGQRSVKADVADIAFSPDGTHLAGIGLVKAGKSAESAQTFLWEGANSDELKEVRATPMNPSILGASQLSQFFSVAYGPDGLLAVWASRISPALWLLDAETGAEVRVLKTLTPPASVVFNKGGTRMFTLSHREHAWDNKGLIWKEWDTKPIDAVPVHPLSPGPQEVTVRSRNGERQARYQVGLPRAISDKTDPPAITISDRDGREVHVFRGHSEHAEDLSVRFSPNGRLVLSVAVSGETRVWETETGDIRHQFDSKLPARGSFSRGSIYYPYTLPQRHAEVSPDGRLLSLLDAKGIWVVNFDDLSKRFTVGQAVCTYFSPDSRRLISVHQTGEKAGEEDSRAQIQCEIKMWDVASGCEVHTQPIGNSTVIFRPGDHWFLTSNRQLETTVWDATTGEKHSTLQGADHKGITPRLRNQVFSPDGTRLITSEGVVSPLNRGGPRVWDVASGKELFRLEGHSADVLASAFSPDGKRIATVAVRRPKWEVKLWDAASGRELLSLQLSPRADQPRLPALLSPSLSFSPDGHRLTLYSRGRALATWNATPRDE